MGRGGKTMLDVTLKHPANQDSSLKSLDQVTNQNRLSTYLSPY